MKHVIFTTLLIAVLLSSKVHAVLGETISPPDVRVVDSLGVNVATGAVEYNVDTVSIGGERGLNHSVQVYANFFDAVRGYGFRDKYAGGVTAKMFSEERGELYENDIGVLSFRLNDGTNGKQITGVRVFGLTGSQEFVVEQGGEYITSNFSLTDDSYNFVPLGDKRHSLYFKNEGGKSYLVWRTPEGVETLFERGVTDKTTRSITRYPNGFTVYVGFGAVWTNTGFMLKYDMPVSYNSTMVDGYWGFNPKMIAGVNLAYQYCSEDTAVNISTCNVGDADSPKAVFTWPTGSPLVFYTPSASDLVFTIKDQFYEKTQFYYQAQDICRYRIVDASGISQDCASKYSGRNRYAPRLQGVKSAQSNVIDFNYSYENFGTVKQETSGSVPGVRITEWWWNLSSKIGRVATAKNKRLERGYGEPYSTSQYNYNIVRESGGNRVQLYKNHPGILERIQLRRSGSYSYEYNSRNFVTSHVPLSGPSISYGYDDAQGGRGNLYKITSNATVVKEAEYYASCTDSNFKYCNKPKWVKDANRHQTDYAYHASSGQVSLVQMPAVEVNGVMIRPTTRYNYEQKYAYFFDASGVITRSDTPLWLLTQEHTCRSSNTTATGCSGGNIDMVKTNYYYGEPNTPNNLFLLGKSVTAEGESGVLETRVWCYEYNKHGKVIRESSPKNNVNLQSCQL